jgi:hypothetical protein
MMHWGPKLLLASRKVMFKVWRGGERLFENYSVLVKLRHNELWGSIAGWDICCITGVIYASPLNYTGSGTIEVINDLKKVFPPDLMRQI